MFKKKDPYQLIKFSNLKNGEEIIGTIFSEFQVTSYDDVQLQNEGSVKKKKYRKFLVQCSQRICIYNPDGMVLSPNNKKNYLNYPVLINTSISVDSLLNDYQLVDYSPQTINTQIQSSGTSGGSDGKTSGTSTSNTVGSSTSQTNTFGVSVSIGNMWGGSISNENSSTSASENSNTSGSENSISRTNELSNSAEMSIKDWGAYAFVHPEIKRIAWNFGQEYPWNAIICRRTNDKVIPDNEKNPDQVEVIVPSAMLHRLYDGVSLYPPSQLSMFGVNFVMKSIWLVVVIDGNPDDITIKQSINYFTGSHVISGDPIEVKIYIDKQPTVLNISEGESTTIDLALMALDPIGTQSKAAIIGFIPNKFNIKPSPFGINDEKPINFKIRSGTNDLLIKDSTTYPNECKAGAGFSPSETALIANIPNDKDFYLQMTLYFKVIDTTSNYSLFMKHWKTGMSAIALTFVINGDVSKPITKYVDALEAEGGENNLLSFALRNQDFASIDYSDHLQLGLNSIQITIKSLDSTDKNCGYQIRAISIEKV